MVLGAAGDGQAPRPAENWTTPPPTGITGHTRRPYAVALGDLEGRDCNSRPSSISGRCRSLPSRLRLRQLLREHATTRPPRQRARASRRVPDSRADSRASRPASTTLLGLSRLVAALGRRVPTAEHPRSRWISSAELSRAGDAEILRVVGGQTPSLEPPRGRLLLPNCAGSGLPSLTANRAAQRVRRSLDRPQRLGIDRAHRERPTGARPPVGGAGARTSNSRRAREADRRDSCSLQEVGRAFCSTSRGHRKRAELQKDRSAKETQRGSVRQR